MKIMVISDPNNKDRVENIKTQFANQEGDWKYEIVEAVMNPAQSQVGIMRSWKKCIEKAKVAWEPEVMILENDFNCLTPGSLQHFNNLYFLDYGIFKGLLLASVYEGEIDQLNDQIAKVNGKISGLTAVIVSEEWYDILLQMEEPYHLDYWISEIAKIPIYCTHPFLIIQGVFPSANGNNMEELNANLGLKYKLAGR